MSAQDVWHALQHDSVLEIWSAADVISWRVRLDERFAASLRSIKQTPVNYARMTFGHLSEVVVAVVRNEDHEVADFRLISAHLPGGSAEVSRDALEASVRVQSERSSRG